MYINEEEIKVHINQYIYESQKAYIDKQAEKNKVKASVIFRNLIQLGIEADERAELDG